MKLTGCCGVMVLVGCGVIALGGCATIKEGAKCTLGISTQVLEDGRKNAVTRDFNHGYDTCYNKVKEALRKIESRTYAGDQKKHMIAVYFSDNDTTPVGIFFTELDKDNTRVEVSSPSTFSKEVISRRVFARVAGLADPYEIKAKSPEKASKEKKPAEPETQRREDAMKNDGPS